MKLKVEQLNPHLHQDFRSIYFVTGDEPLLVQEACDAIRKTAHSKGFTERKIFEADSQFDWGEFLQEANAMSLFAEQKIIDLRLTKGKPGDKGSKALIEYLKQPSPDVLLLVTAPKLEAQTAKAKWASELEKAGVMIQIWPLEANQMINWIRQRSELIKLQIEPDAIQLLAERSAGNLLAASQELEKLKLLKASQVTLEDIESSTGDHARFDVFNLAEACLAGNIAATSRIFNHLKQDGTEVTLLLWVITKEIRTLIELIQSHNLQQSYKSLRIWPKRQPVYKQALSRLNRAELYQCLQQAEALDQSLKAGDSHLMQNLEALTLSLAGFKLSASL